MVEQPGQSEWKWQTEESNGVCSWSGRASGRCPLQRDGSLVLSGPCSCLVPFSLQCLLQGQHSRACTIQKIPGEHSWQLLDQGKAEPKRRGALLHLILTSKEGLVGNVKIKENLGCSGHGMVVLRSPKGGPKTSSHLRASGEHTMDSSSGCGVQYRKKACRKWKQEAVSWEQCRVFVLVTC